MIVKFDSLNRFETPNLFLCNPGSKTLPSGEVTNVIGIIPNTSDEELVLNFNSLSELNFRIHKVKYDDNSDDEFSNRMFDAVQNRRMILVEDIGYFSIQSISNGYTDADGYYKDVNASSVEIELENKMIPFIGDGTYAFGDIMTNLLSVVPMWKLGEIDEGIAIKYRTFKDVDVTKNILSFMQDDVQHAYECVFEYDIMERLIHVRDIKSSLINTDIFLTKDDVVNNINVSEQSDNLFTALRVEGVDNLNISPVNPLGTNVIYDFRYYENWMNKSLRDSVELWYRLIEKETPGYISKNTEYYKLLEELSNYNAEVERLNIQIDMYQKCRSNVVAEQGTSNIREYNKIIEENGGTPVTPAETIENTVIEINRLCNEAIVKRDKAESFAKGTQIKVDSLKNSIKDIQNRLAIENFFTREQYDDLYHYIYEGVMREEYITVSDDMTYPEKFEQMKKLYDKAMEQLKIVSNPSYEFSIDVDGFIFEKNFMHYTEQINTGCVINVELYDNDIEPLFLSSISVNYQDHSMSLTFGNKYRLSKFDIKTMFDDLLGNIRKSSNTLDYIKGILEPVKDGEIDKLREALQTSRDLTMDAALSSINQEVVIDATGYTGKKKLDSGAFDPKQIKIVNNSIVFTDDNWNSCKTALGEIRLGSGKSTYGINAETIMGDMIIGGGLKIIDKDGNDMFSVIDNKISASVSDKANSTGGINGFGYELTSDGFTLNSTINGKKEEVMNVSGTKADIFGWHMNNWGIWAGDETTGKKTVIQKPIAGETWWMFASGGESLEDLSEYKFRVSVSGMAVLEDAVLGDIEFGWHVNQQINGKNSNSLWCFDDQGYSVRLTSKGVRVGGDEGTEFSRFVTWNDIVAKCSV